MGPHDIRDAVIYFVKRWAKRTGIAVARFIASLVIAPSKDYDWQCRYGTANEPNALIPRDFWLEDWAKQGIVDFHLEHPLKGYQRLTFMMLDRDVVAVGPSSVTLGEVSAAVFVIVSGFVAQRVDLFAELPGEVVFENSGLALGVGEGGELTAGAAAAGAAFAAVGQGGGTALGIELW